MVRVSGLVVLIGVLGALAHFNFSTNRSPETRNQFKDRPRRILMDMDVDMDDFFGIFYLLKQNTSEFNLQVFSFSLFMIYFHMFIDLLLLLFLI